MTGNISPMQGNLFRTDMETIAITVNCVGIMGKGIALTLKNQAKPAYENYRELCEAGKMNLGKSVIYDKPLDDLEVVQHRRVWEKHWIVSQPGDLRFEDRTVGPGVIEEARQQPVKRQLHPKTHRAGL